MSKSILILGNMANDGYAVAKELVKMNVDVTLAVNNMDFGMGMPEWEELELHDVDPHHAPKYNLKDRWNPPKWIRYFDFEAILTKRPKVVMKRLKESLAIRKMIREYDVVEAHVPFSIIAKYSGRPYVTYDAGWIRKFESRGSWVDRIGQKAYSESKKIIFTNADTERIFNSLPLLSDKPRTFIPFSIDSDYYKPQSKKDYSLVDEKHFLVFQPTRHTWEEKGNDIIIKSFAKLVKNRPDARLLMVAWNHDVSRSMLLCKQLNITSKVMWIPPVSKPTLIKLYDRADVIADQFICGSFGTTTLEAMSCQKPVLIYYDKYTKMFFGSNPPTPSVRTLDDVTHQLQKLADDEEYRLKVGKESRQWVKKTHNPKLVARKHLEVLQ